MKTPDLEWPWYVRGYYGSEAESPKRKGDLAFETKHKTESSRDMEIEAARSRDDIGYIDSGRRFI